MCIPLVFNDILSADSIARNLQLSAVEFRNLASNRRQSRGRSNGNGRTLGQILLSRDRAGNGLGHHPLVGYSGAACVNDFLGESQQINAKKTLRPIRGLSPLGFPRIPMVTCSN